MKRLVALGLVATAVVTVGGPASAKHKKPITKTYTVTAPLPDPTNFSPQAKYSVCAQTVPQSFGIEKFKASEPGKLVVEMSGFLGDWDLLLMDSRNNELGYAGLTNPVDGDKEKVTYKVKKAMEVRIVACNWSGGPTATVKYTFTYDK